MSKHIIERRPHPQGTEAMGGWAYAVVESPDDAPHRRDLAYFIDNDAGRPTAELRAHAFLNRLVEGSSVVRTEEVSAT